MGIRVWQTGVNIGRVAGPAGSIDFNVEAGGLSNGLSDVGEALEWKVAAFDMGDGSGGGVDLD